MCLGIPGRILDVSSGGPVRMGRVDFEGVTKNVCLEHIDDPRPGQYVLVHVGFALSRIDEQEAQRVFAMLRELPELNELEGSSTDALPLRDRVGS